MAGARAHPRRREATLLARRFFRHTLGDIAHFSRVLVGRPLRPYQREVATAVLASVRQRRGALFTVEMARQMGKNEVSAQVEAYLLFRYQLHGGTIVKCAPTFQPQTLISRLRLEEVLSSPWLLPYWRRVHGTMVEVGKARVLFLSAHEEANVVGATASLLLEVDESQEFVKEFLPMAAAANATVVLYGTPWTRDTLLAKYKAANLAHEARTGERRHFAYPWQVGAAHNPWYAQAVQAQIAQRGADDLLVRTQYLLEEVDDAVGFFTPELRTALRGSHLREHAPQDGRSYVAAVDVAGEAAEGESRERDSTVALIAARTWQEDPVLGLTLPALEVVNAYAWTGMPMVEQYRRLVHLLGTVWQVEQVVVDATGLGDGLARLLAARLGTQRVEPFVFTGASKHALAAELRLAVASGRLRMWVDDGSPECARFWEEVERCRLELRPGGLLSFHVPSHAGHDDNVMALALLTRALLRAVPPHASVALPPLPATPNERLLP